MGNRKTVCIILFLILSSVTACGKESLEPEKALPEDQQEDIIIAGEAGQEIIEDPDEENINVDAGKEEEEQEEDEEMEEAVPTYTYRGDAVLTQENFRKTMKTFLCIKSTREFYKLEELPLTEKFFNECLEHFPFINDLADMKEFYIAFWGAGEDNKIICLCEFRKNTSYPYNRDCYYIVMEIENDQIDSMEMTLVQKSKSKN